MPRVEGVSFRSHLHPTPGPGYVAQEGHSWAKYNLGWAAVLGRDEEGGHSLLLPPQLSFWCQPLGVTLTALA